jgi:diguanylate cyclase (GGDEF)-like protein
VIGATALLTVLSIIISVAITVCINLIMSGEVGPMAIVSAVAVPAVISPLFGGLTLRLAHRLDLVQDRLRRLAITDDLTHAFNRRYFFEAAEREMARARRTGEAFSVVILDMDDFKQINDTYGHMVGDVVLQKVAALCLANARAMDTFARYGGEEFVFLLPRMERAQALKFCERIQQALTQSQVKQNGNEIHFSASIGVGTYEPGVADVDSLVTRADRAMYKAKARGKNTIVSMSEVS